MTSRRDAIAAIGSTVSAVALAGCFGILSGGGDGSAGNNTTAGTTVATTGTPTATTTRTDGGNGGTPTPSGPPVRWERSFGNPVSNTLTVADGLVLGSHSSQESGALFALDAGDGGTRFTKSTTAPVTSAPTVLGDTVYAISGVTSGIGGSKFTVRAVGTDGSDRWTYRPEGADILDFLGATGERVFVGGHGSPISEDGNFTYAVDRGDGTEAWRVETGDVNDGGVAGDACYVATVGGTYSLSTAGGDRNWLNDAADRFRGVAGGRPIVGTGSGIAALDTGDGSEAWSFEPTGVVNDVHAEGSTLVASVVERAVVGLDPATGDRTFTFDHDGRSARVDPVSGDRIGVVAANVGGQNRTVVHVLGVDGSQQWSVDLGSGVENAIPTSGAVVALETDPAAVVTVGSDGTERWRTEPGATVTDLVVGEGAAVVATAAGRVRAIDLRR